MVRFLASISVVKVFSILIGVSASLAGKYLCVPAREVSKRSPKFLNFQRQNIFMSL